MVLDKHLDPALKAELEQAKECFYETVDVNPQLSLLLLVDPIQALEDAGARLSERARRYIRRTYLGRAYGNTELYSAVRSGKIQLPWLGAIRVHREAPERESKSNSPKGE